MAAETQRLAGMGDTSPVDVASFVVKRWGNLAPDGRPRGRLPDFADNRETLSELYRAMVLTRTFDTKAVSLQRTGRLGTFASSLGQEGVAVGAAAAMRPDDVLVPSFREQGAQLFRGVRAAELLLYWGGDERGSDFSGPREDFPICVPIGTHAAHAAGVGLALRLRGETRAVVCVMGDGATSRGDVYESMNYVGVKKLPVVFVVNNNQYAISTRRFDQTAAETLAQKAIAVGMPGEQVDGNDVIAVRARVEDALERARNGEGGTVIEAITYRLADHTTADDASRYRDDDEVSGQWPFDPVARLRVHLVSRDWWSPQDENDLLDECQGLIDAAVEEYLDTAPDDPASMFDHLHETLPEPLAPQRRDLLTRVGPTIGEGHA